MRRTVIFLAMFALALCELGMAGAAAVMDGDFEYLVGADGTAAITGYLGSATELTIPDRLGGHPVKRIEEYAFSNNRNLKAVIFPLGLETIGLRAFVNCTALKDLHIPASVTGIGDSAFLFTKLAEIAADAANPAYRTVDGVLFHLPSNTLHTYPPAKKGADYTVPNGTMGIENGAFSYCTALKKVVLPDSLTRIGTSAFYGCSALKALNIPTGVLHIGTGAFQATGLKTITVDEGNPAYEQRDGVLFELANQALHTFPALKRISEYRIPIDTQSILPYAFADCAGPERVVYPEGMKNTFYQVFYYTLGLKEAVLPESLETIDTYTFYYCKNLKSVNIPSRVTSIGYCAFAGCESLRDLVLPEGLKQIDGSAFNWCTGLKRVNLPDSLETIGDGAFQDCPKLTLIVGAGTFAQKYAVDNGIPHKLR